MQSQTCEIEGPVDFELRRPRTRPLRYVVSTPDAGTPKGLVFVIPGFGADSKADYAEKLRRHICDTHGMAAVSVDYHCIQARPENGAILTVPPREHFMLIGVAAHHGIKLTDNNNLTELTTKLAKLNATIDAYADITPGGGEYQNFGILQAMDHLAVLADIVANGPAFDRSHIIAFGSSHGGYIAHLMAKLAPGSISLVMDNSSYTRPPIDYLGIGLQGEYRTRMGGVTLACRIKDGWSLDDRNAANFYNRDADLIRDVAYPPHLDVMKAASAGDSPAVVMVNAAEDVISPPAAKLAQARFMKAAGLSAQVDIIDRSQIDGRVFKSQTHGLDASLKALFDRFWSSAKPRQGRLDCEAGTVLDYPCIDRSYRFIHGASGVAGEIHDRFRVEED